MYMVSEFSFLLEERHLIRGFSAHVAVGLGGAADYTADDDPIHSPTDGKVAKQYFGSDGGNWLWIEDKHGNMWEFAHLSAYKCKVGDSVKKGQIVAISGNTGAITTGPHLHVQIIAAGFNGDPIKGKRLDPELLLKGAPLPMANSQYDNKIIRFNGVFAYVKAGSGQKQLISRENAGLAVITFIQRANTSTHIKEQINNVTQVVWDGFVTVPSGTWF